MKEIALALIPATLPSLMVLVGILLNRNDTNRLSAEVAGLRMELRSEVVLLRTDLSALRTELKAEVGALRTEMTGLRNVFHGDVVSLLEHDRDQDVRITRLEGN